MDTGRRTAVLLLALIYAAIAALSLGRAALPMDADTPVTLLTVLGVVALLGAVLIGSTASWFGNRALHTAVVIASVLIGVIAWRSATAVGVVGLGPAMIAVEVLIAHVFTRRVALLHTALLVGAGTAGAVAAAPDDFVTAWAALIVSVVVLGEVQNRISAQLRAAADTDPLTKIANRRAWESQFARYLSHTSRTGEPLSVAILDLDDFKAVNDRDGHAAGDALLRELASSWARRLRRADVLGRYGGDEFVLCLPGTDEAGARRVLEQLDTAHEFRWTSGLTAARAGDTVTSALARADADLYERKRRNRRA